MVVLGIDASLTATGLAVLRDGQLQAATTVKAGERREAERLAWISDKVLGWALQGFNAGELYQPVDLVAIEGYAYNALLTQAFATGELGGVIRYRLREAGIPYVVLPPATWRKLALGNGRIDKSQVRLEVFKRYQVEIEDHNALEAFGVAMAGYLEATGQSKPRASRRRRAA